MADKAISESADLPIEAEEPTDLIVRTSTRTPESHQSRSRRHATEGEEWSEAERTISDDMAKQRKSAT
jgi:hypothetical protein